MQRHRTHIAAKSMTIGTVFIIFLLAFSPAAVFGQEADDEPDAPVTQVFLPFLSTGGLEATTDAAAATTEIEEDRRGSPPLKLLIDTDPGVDDAIALTWLLSQTKVPINLLGIVTVAGNTDVVNATNNVLNVLARLPVSNIPVVVGATKPMSQTLSKTGWFIHGPTGLWFLGLQPPLYPAGVLNQDATVFYCATVRANPGATLLALGPLTNIANAVVACRGDMQKLGSVVVLGGAKYGGNKTPVAEFNFWQDPEAADIVLNAGLPIRQVPLDAFTRPTIQLKDVDKLAGSRNPAMAFLAPALQQYVTVQIDNTGIAAIPDAVAAIFALDPTIGPVQPALVNLELAVGQTRGQSVVGLTLAERLAMIADDAELSALAECAFFCPPEANFNLQVAFGQILAREPDNVQGWLTTAPNNLLTKVLLPVLRK